MSANTTERRASRRVPIDVFVNKYIKGRPYLCRATDLSPDGVCLERVTEPTNHERFVGLQFQLPGSPDVITCTGRIVRGSAAGGAAGVQFNQLRPEHQRRIERFMSSAGAGWTAAA